MNCERMFSKSADSVGVDPIADVAAEVGAAAANNPDLVNAAAGTPRPDALRITELAEMTVEAVQGKEPSAWLYSSAQGLPETREAIQEVLKQRGVVGGLERTFVAAGAQHALALTAETFLDPDDVVLMAEGPTFPVAAAAFQKQRARMVGVSCDESGVIPGALEEAVEQYSPKLLYIMPVLHNPTGHTTSPERLAAIADVIKRRELLALEDDVYSYLRFDPPTAEQSPPLQALAPDNVVYISSLCKIMAPGARVGWAVAPEEVVAKLAAMRVPQDMHSAGNNQLLLAHFIRKGFFEKQVQLMRKTYSERAVALDQALRQHLPESVTWKTPEGGLFMWLTGPEDLDMDEGYRRALQLGVAVMQGSAFYVDKNPPRNSFRINFANVPTEKASAAAKALGKALFDVRS